MLDYIHILVSDQPAGPIPACGKEPGIFISTEDTFCSFSFWRFSINRAANCPFLRKRENSLKI
jgi:hypothetical protein